MKYLPLYLLVTVFILCACNNACTINTKPTFQENSLTAIQKRGTFLVGTTGTADAFAFYKVRTLEFQGQNEMSAT